jgi:putative hydrolase of the HAD superfamily
MIKAVLFDYGGVIAHDPTFIEGMSRRIARELALDHGLHGAAIQAVLDRYKRGHLERSIFWSELAKELAVKDAGIAEQAWIAPGGLKPDQRILDLAADLRHRGYKTGIVSNVFPHSKTIIADHGGYDGFDPLILSCDVGLIKPEPEIYQLALDKLDLPAEEVLFIDDLTANLETAESLGMQTLLAQSPDQIIADLSAQLGLKDTP